MVIRVRWPQIDLTGCTALWRRDRREVARQHLCGGDKLDCLVRGRSQDCGLLPRKEKQPVLDDRPADSSSELIPFQVVTRFRECIARVEDTVANKFEKIAVNIIGSCLSHSIDRCR